MLTPGAKRSALPGWAGVVDPPSPSTCPPFDDDDYGDDEIGCRAAFA
jgi:hypothetical protein